MLLQPGKLKGLYRAGIGALGGTSAEADVFADMFIIADLRGMDWQGLKSLEKNIVLPIRQGVIRLGQEIEVLREDAASVILDAHDELGQVTCKRGIEAAIAKARESGCGVAVIRNAGDSGLLAAYTMLALDQDCIGLMFNNTNPYVAPWGGSERTHGIDPISVAIPAREQYPIVLDMAVTQAQSFFDHEELWSRPFPRPQLMFFETVREYALSVVIELMCGALAAMPIGRDKSKRGECAVFTMAIHIPHFIDIADFRDRVDSYVHQVKSSSPQGEQPILLPGERGFQEQTRRERVGIPIDETVWSRTIALIEELGLGWESAKTD